MAQPDGGLDLHDVTASVAEAAGDSRCVVALGGGADSAVLLAATVQRADPATTRAVFVAHELEGSALLEKAASELCGSLNVDLEVVAAPVAAGANLEARARDARYAALDNALRPGEVGLLGHTLDDSAETVLMRLSHGAGASGLSGIAAQRGRWHRPLLGSARASIRGLADELKLIYADDPDNEDRRFERVRIRNVVVPSLNEATSGATDGLARSAALISLDDAVLVDLSSGVPIATERDRVALPAAAISTAPIAIGARASLRALHRIEGMRPTADDVSAVLECAASGTTQQLSGNVLAVNTGPTVIIGKPLEPDPPQPIEIGTEFAWAWETYEVIADVPGPVLPGGRFTVLNADIDTDAMVARGYEPGDRVDIGTGHTPVKEVLRTAGVHASLRSVSLVITVGGTIAAVAGIRTAAWASPVHGDRAIIIKRKVHP